MPALFDVKIYWVVAKQSFVAASLGKIYKNTAQNCLACDSLFSLGFFKYHSAMIIIAHAAMFVS